MKILSEVLLNIPKKIKDNDYGNYDEQFHNHYMLKDLHKLPNPVNSFVENAHIHSAIKAYTGDKSYMINKVKIDPDFFTFADSMKRYSKHHENLENHIKNSKPLPEPVSTFSGLSQNHIKNSNLKVGHIFHTPIFTSTSLNPNLAEKFAQNHPGKSFGLYNPDKGINSSKFTSHIIHFKLPKGYDKGAYIAPHSQAPEEREFLLAPDQKWKITNHQINYKKDIIKPYPLSSIHPPSSTHPPETIHSYHHIWTVEPHKENSE